MEQSLIFGGINSSDYGIYISGEGVFNAPKRDVETISIPGRNGVFLLDHNRFDNIVVTYPAHCKTDNLEEFRALLRDYRNALLSLSGYQRLTDTLNGDEYRMGAFIDSFDAEPIGYSTAATFDLKFNCKPQRFLKIGDLPVSVASGDAITNPTLFDAHPLISCVVSDDGTLSVGDMDIVFNPAPLGIIGLLNPFSIAMANVGERAISKAFGSNAYRSGDVITVASGIRITAYSSFNSVNSIDVPTITGDSQVTGNIGKDGSGVTIDVATKDAMTFSVGTSSTRSVTISVPIRYQTDPSSTVLTTTMTVTFALEYDGADEITARLTMPDVTGATGIRASAQTSTITVNSTKSSFEGTVYIDADIGEAYTITDNHVVSVNNFVYMGAELPVLPPGSTTITYSNTISNVEITPRYWRV